VFDDLTKMSDPSTTEAITEIHKALKPTPFNPKDILLLDADTLAYTAAAVTDGSQWWLVEGTKEIGPYKYKKDAVLAEKSFSSTGLRYEQRWEPEPVENAIKILKSKLVIFSKNKCEYYLTPKGNFRDDVLSTYKANRKGKRRPEHLTACKVWLEENVGARTVVGYEADDMVIIRAKELEEAAEPWVIVGVDKDLKQIRGKFSDYTGKHTVVTDIGGRYNLWEQIAAGDSTDNIKTPRGLGKVGFKKAFASVDWLKTDDFTLVKMMHKLYCTKEKQRDGETEAEYHKRIFLWIQQTARLVYLVRSYKDKWILPKDDKGIRW